VESNRVKVTVTRLQYEDSDPTDEECEKMELQREDKHLGQFNFSFLPETSGHYLLEARVDSRHVPGSPFKLWCIDVWKTTKIEETEESIFPAYMQEMTRPAWIGEHQLVVVTERNNDPENEHSKPKLELMSMDRNGDWEAWKSYGLSALPDDQAHLPRRLSAALSLHEEPAMIMFGGIRDGKKDKDAKASDPAPQILLQEPLMVQFDGPDVFISEPQSIEGVMPSARCGHSLGREHLCSVWWPHGG